MSSQVDINNTGLDHQKLQDLESMKDEFNDFQQRLTGTMSSIPGVSEAIMAQQKEIGNNLPNFEESLKEIGLTPEDMKEYTKKLLKGQGCAIGDNVCRDKVRRAKATAEYTESQMAFEKAKTLMEEKKRTFELVEFDGEDGLRKHTLTQGEKAGEMIKEEKIRNHKFMKNKIQNNIDILTDQDVYADHMDDLYSMLALNAIETEAEVDYMVNKNNVDNRKVYYEDQSTLKYVWINKYLKYIYWIILVVLFIIESYAWYKGKLKFSPYAAVGYSLFMLLYPFLMDTIIGGVLFLLRQLYNNTPKDVYMNI